MRLEDPAHSLRRHETKLLSEMPTNRKAAATVRCHACCVKIAEDAGGTRIAHKWALSVSRSSGDTNRNPWFASTASTSFFIKREAFIIHRDFIQRRSTLDARHAVGCVHLGRCFRNPHRLKGAPDRSAKLLSSSVIQISVRIRIRNFSSFHRIWRSMPNQTSASVRVQLQAAHQAADFMRVELRRGRGRSRNDRGWFRAIRCTLQVSHSRGRGIRRSFHGCRAAMIS